MTGGSVGKVTFQRTISSPEIEECLNLNYRSEFEMKHLIPGVSICATLSSGTMTLLSLNCALVTKTSSHKTMRPVSCNLQW